MTAHYRKPINRTPITKEEIIRQLGFGKEKGFRLFTKSELEARISDPRSEEERDLDELAADEAATINSIRPGC